MSEAALSAATDPGIFAEKLLGRPLFDYQLDFARSKARYRAICAGRQVGKSTVLSVVTLFEASTRRNITVMLVSAGEAASQRLLRECATLAAGSSLLRGSVLDESKSSLTLSNGSRILSVPASEKQIRGNPIDVLALDEAAFIDERIWQSAEPAIAARPGSRVILTSTPWGIDHFFRRIWQRGMTSPDAMYESWHWPSSMSPLMDQGLLDEIRSRENPITFAREYLAEWADASNLLLTPDELAGAVLDYELVPPELADRVHGYGREGRWLSPQCVAGLDYGKSRDANALVVVGALDDCGLNVDVRSLRAGSTSSHTFFIPWLEAHYGMSYERFGEVVTDAARGYNLRLIASEVNGPGAGAHEFVNLAMMRASERGELASRFGDGRGTFGTGGTHVAPVWTDNRRKAQMFGRMRGMLQSGQLLLPRHTELLKQLGSLTMVETAAGNTSISVPESAGHDDIALATGQALANIGSLSLGAAQRFRPLVDSAPVAEIAEGRKVPLPPRMLQPANGYVFNAGTAGAENGVPW